MSLLAWFPFTKNGNNQGTTNVNFNIDNMELVAGKLGNCLKIDNHTSSITLTELPNSKQVSFAFWFRELEETCTSWEDFIMIQTHYDDGTKVTDGETRLENFNNSSTGKVCANWYSSVFNKSYPTVTSAIAIGSNFQVGTNIWHHSVFQVDFENHTWACWFDGKFISKQTINPNALYFTGLVRVGDDSITCNLNDLRIYDHLLSTKEIKDIYKTCILHYSFDKEFINDNLIIESNKLSSWVVEGCTKEDYIDDELGSCLKITSNKDNGRIYRNVNNVWMIREETFTVSFWARSDEDNVLIDASRSIADFSKTFNLIKEWRRYVGYIKIWGTNSAGTLSIRIHSANKTIYIKDVKLEKGNNVTNWCPNKDDELYDELGFNDNIIYDESGYNHNATIMKEGLIFDTDSALGTNCIKFSGNQDVTCNITDIFNGEPNSFSFSCWINLDDYYKGYNNIISFSSNNLRFRIVGYSAISTIYLNTDTNTTVDNVVQLTESFIENEWNHLCITLNENIFKYYINGKYAGSYTKEGNIIKSSNVFRIGTYNGSSEFLIGKLDDIKIFKNILSDEDVKELYEAKMKIDKNNNIYTNNFAELRQNSFYFDLNKMSGWHDDVLSVVNYTAKSISFRFNKQPVAWESRWFPLEEFLEDKKTYILYIKMSANCNKNLEDGTDNQYARTYGTIGIHKYKISDNTVVKSEIGLRKLQLYTIQFTVDYSIYKNYELRFYPNCIDITSWNKGDYIYDYIDIVPIEENYNTNISKKSCLNTGEFLENNSLSNIKLEKYNRTNITEIIEI